MYGAEEKVYFCDVFLASQQAQPVSIEEKSITYRSLQDPREVHVKLLLEGVDTMAKMLHFVAKLHGHKRCLGTREILAEEDEIQPNKRVFKKVRS
jgi:long-chain acyl-CoA synthetase